MKTARTFAAMILLSGLVPAQAGLVGRDDDWLARSVVLTTTETVERDEQGDRTSATLVKDERICATRRVTETSARDKDGVLRLVSRRTETIDGVGGSWIVDETKGSGVTDLKVTRVTTVDVAGAKGAVDAAKEDNDWLAQNVITTTTETVDRDDKGNRTGMTVVREDKVSASRRTTESRVRDKYGVLRLMSRRTETHDHFGGSTVVDETLVGDDTDLKVTRMVSVVITGNGSITATQQRNKLGNLDIVERTTKTMGDEGIVVTTHEKIDSGGKMIVTRTTSIY